MATTDLSTVYPEASRLVHAIEHNLLVLERGENVDDVGEGGGVGGVGQTDRWGQFVDTDDSNEGAVATSKLLNTVSRDVNALSHHVTSLQHSVQRQSGHRKEMWRLRVKSLADRAASVRRDLERLLNRKYRRQRDDDNRRALLGDASAAVVVDCAVKEGESLQHSNRLMDDLLETSTSILSNLTEQGGMLKRAHMSALAMANTLGLSNSLMRVIQRRTSGDKLIVYGGMAAVLLLLFFVYRFVR